MVFVKTKQAHKSAKNINIEVYNNDFKIIKID